MKILHAINSLSAGGAETFLVNLAIAQQKAGHDVSVFAYAGILDDKGKTLERMLTKNGVGFFSPRITDNKKKIFVPVAMRTTITAINPTVIHSHLEQSDLFLAIATVLLRKKPRLVRTIHNIYFPKSIPRIAHRWLSKHFDLSIACGKAVSDQYPYLGSRKLCIENGVNIEELSAQTTSSEIRTRFNISATEPLLINVGSFNLRSGVLQKAQDLILDAVSMIKPSPKVIFLGDGSQRIAMQQRAQSLGLEKTCFFLGNVGNPIDYINAANLVVMPSRFEGLSIACIEAVCLGKPVLLSDIPSFSAFDADSTIYVDAESANDLAAGIRRYLSEAISLDNFAQQCKEMYRQRYSIAHTADQYIQVYKSL